MSRWQRCTLVYPRDDVLWAYPGAGQIVGMAKARTVVIGVHDRAPAVGVDVEALGVAGLVATVGPTNELALRPVANTAHEVFKFSCKKQERLDTELVDAEGGGLCL